RLGVQAREVELQRVALVEVKARIAGELGIEDGDQVEVELDHVQACAAVEQAFGQCALAGADLQQTFTLPGVDGAENAMDDAGIVQKILAEAFARAVLVFGHGGAAPEEQLEA